MLYRTKPRRTCSQETLQAIPRGTQYELKPSGNGRTFVAVFDLAVSDSILKQGKVINVSPWIDFDYTDSLRMEQIRISNAMRGIRAHGFRSFDGSLA